MKKIDLVILSGLLIGLIIADAHAQQAPFGGCKRPPPFEDWVECDVLENNFRINNIILNRGNCKSPIQDQNELIDDMEKVVQGRTPSDPIRTDVWFKGCVFRLGNDNKRLCYEETKKQMLRERIFQFGDRFTFLVRGCNLLESTFETNKGDWTMRWR